MSVDVHDARRLAWAGQSSVTVFSKAATHQLVL